MLFKILRPIGTLWLKLCYPFKVYGKENISHEGNTVVICNHLCKVDVPFVGVLFKGKTYYLAKKEWFNNKFLSWFFTNMGGVPINRDNPDIASTKKALGILKSGNRLCVFPEGTRNKDGTEIMPLHGGAGVFAFKTGAKIIPINIHHKARFWGKNYIYVGKAFDFSEFDGQRLDTELNARLTEKMYNELCNSKQILEEILIKEGKIKKK